MQIELDHISIGEDESGQSSAKELIDHSIASDSNRTAGGLMRGHNQTSAMPLCGDRHLPTIKHVPAGATCRMGELLVGGQGEALLDLRQIQQGIVFAAHHEADSCNDQIHDDGSIAIQPIESNEGLTWLKTQCGLIGNDHGESPYQLAPVISIAGSSRGEEPLLSMGLQKRCTSTDNLPTLASRVAGRTHRRQTPLRWRQIKPLRQSTLSIGLAGAIEIDSSPSCSLPIPQPPHLHPWSQKNKRILEDNSAQTLHQGPAQAGNDA